MEEEIFREIENHLIEDKEPSKYIRENLHKLKRIGLGIIEDLEKVEQSPTHHPEGNVLNHVLLVVDAAAKVRELSKNKEVLMWSALFHDIGKKRATRRKKGRIIAYDHDRYGKEELEKIFRNYDFLDDRFKEEVIKMVGYHMHSLYIIKDLPFGDKEKMVRDVDLEEMFLLFFADRLGRGAFSEEAINGVKEEMFIIMDKLEGDFNLNLDKIRKNIKEIT